MKRNALIVFLIISYCQIAFSQPFKVGQASYPDITFVCDTVNEFHQLIPTSDWFEYVNPISIPFDIDKDGLPDLSLKLNGYMGNRGYYEHIYNINIGAINNCQLVHLGQGNIIEEINWNSFKENSFSLNFYYYLSNGIETTYLRDGLCETDQTQYFAFRISTSSDPNTITGWLEVHSTYTSLKIVRYAYVSRRKPIITCDQGTGPFNSNFMLNISFPKPVSGFDSLDINVINGSVNSLTAINSEVYKVEISPALQGKVSVEVPACIALDSNGTCNVASSLFITSFDTIRPGIDIYKTVNDGMTVINGAFDVSVSFNEAVTGFESYDLIIDNGYVTKFDSISPTGYKATITPYHEGELTINVASNAVKDAAGNWNSLSKKFQIVVDLTPPTAFISRVDSTLANGVFDIFLTYSESLRGIPNIVVENGYSTLVSSSGKQFKLSITPTGENVIIRLQPHSFVDIAGNWNVEAAVLKVSVDLTHPTLTISNENKSNVNGSFDAIFTFSEPVKDFKLENIAVSSGRVRNLDSLSTFVYKAIILPLKEGEVIIFVDGGGFKDLAGNVNVVSAKLKVVADFTNPSLIISRTDTTSAIDTFDVSFNFSESILGFENEDISIEGGSLIDFDAITPASYFGTIVPSNYKGSITIYVAANLVQDKAGNSNTASNRLVIDIPYIGIETVTDNLLKIYPNPSNGEIVIEINEQKNLIIEIYNTKGEKVFYKNNYNGEKIDLSRLSIGMYIISLRGKDFSYTSKLIIDAK